MAQQETIITKKGEYNNINNISIWQSISADSFLSERGRFDLFHFMRYCHSGQKTSFSSQYVAKTIKK